MAKKQPKLTPWFPASMKPARAGVYKTHNPHIYSGYSLWTGSMWMNQRHSPSYALDDPGEPDAAVQEKRWRGLAEKPQ